jgi:hypothetical protein
MSIASQLSFSTATSLLAGAAGSIPYQTSSSSTTFLSIGTNGYVLTSNGSVPYWAVSSGGGAGGSSTSTNTILQTGNASYYPTFVDANNATATGELFYTTSSFVINPMNGSLTVGTSIQLSNHTISSYLNSGSLYELTIASRSNVNGGYIKLLHDGAVGGTRGVRLGVNGNGSTPDSGGTDVLVLADSGNVGIGITSPNQKLEVASSSQTASTFVRIANNQGSITNNDVGTALQFYGWDAGITANIKSFREGQSYSPSYLAFETYGGNSVYNTNTLAERMRINGYGNVGVGTTSPNGRFHVADASTNQATLTLSRANNTSGGDWAAEVHSYVGSWSNNLGGMALIVVKDGISATTATSTVGAYGVGFDGAGYFGVKGLYNGGYNASALIFKVAPTGTTISGSLGVGTAASGTTGEIRATNEITAYYSSDITLKENIKLIVDPLGKLEQIRGVSYDWKDEHIQQRGGEDGYFVRKHDIGVIAQEVEAVLPEIVATRDDGIKVVKYEKLVALLIEAVKDQQRQINQISQALQNMAIK